MTSAPASAKASRNGSAGEIIRWTSSGFAVCGLSAFTTTGPMVRLGTKWPSMTSTWIQSAPASSTARTSSPSRAKSADRIEGAMRTGCCTAPTLTSARVGRQGKRGNYPRLFAGEAGDEEAVGAALCLIGARQDALSLLQPIVAAASEEGVGDLLALLRLER